MSEVTASCPTTFRKKRCLIRTAPSRGHFLYLDGHAADFVVILFHADDFFNLAFEFVHVADDAHQAVIARERLQRIDGKPQTLVVERAETLVHEHRIELDAARRTLHLVGKAERQ